LLVPISDTVGLLAGRQIDADLRSEVLEALEITDKHLSAYKAG